MVLHHHIHVIFVRFPFARRLCARERDPFLLCQGHQFTVRLGMIGHHPVTELLTSAFWPFCAANLPHSTSIMPPLAAFIMKVLSAALSLLAALPAGLAAGLAVGAGAFAPLFRGGY